jgi:DNA-binding NtrC family response regulator
VFEAEDGAAALEKVQTGNPDLVITDLRMPGMDGRQLLREVRNVNPEIEVVVVTAYGTVEGAVGCLKEGASDYLLKPLDLEEVEHLVRRAMRQRRLQRENVELRRRLGEIESIPGIVTTGGVMADVLSQVSRVAASTVSILLIGESGTGKELIARAIHAAGPRAAMAFLAVNGGALSATLLESELFGHEKGSFTGAERARTGRFEAASGGTLLLDEVGDLPAEMQIKLLRVLQENTIERVGSNKTIPVDVRVISATHRDLLEEVKQGRFREDLYYRLAVVTIEIPPLRARRGDIPLLVDHFIDKHRGSTGAVRLSRQRARVGEHHSTLPGAGQWRAGHHRRPASAGAGGWERRHRARAGRGGNSSVAGGGAGESGDRGSACRRGRQPDTRGEAPGHLGAGAALQTGQVSRQRITRQRTPRPTARRDKMVESSATNRTRRSSRARYGSCTGID